jgi:hypothetical protein
MRRFAIMLFSGAVWALTAGAAPDTLKVFSGGQFEPGRYDIAPAAGGSRAAPAGGLCIASPEALVHAGLEAVDASNCVNTVIEDTLERATITYSCRGVGSGRTTILLDNRSHFTVDAQGIRGREPFALRQEYKRVGGCS